MRSLQPLVIEIPFGSVDHVDDRRRMPFYRCPATVPEHGIWVHLVMTGEKRDYVMPNPSRKQNGVQQD
jgi:hypothetical protein